MSSKAILIIILDLLFSCLFWSSLLSHAYQFNVGGRDGWITNPTENYNHWAERMRFQVNDTLFFKYKKGLDSVLLVKKDGYDKCETDKANEKMDYGNSVFRFYKSGLFYFVSGDKENCMKGQKMIILVLAIRNKQTPTLTPKPQPPTTSLLPPPPEDIIPPASGYNSTTAAPPTSGYNPTAATPSPPKNSSFSLYNHSVKLVFIITLAIMSIVGFGDPFI